MGSIAIAAAVSLGIGVVQGLLAPKPKPQKTDVGRSNDIRFQTVEEGAFVPKLYGRKVRVAGNCIWGQHTKEHKTTSTTRTGGKGGLIGGGGQTTITETFSYTKSFAILVCDKLPGGKRGRLLRVTENTTTVISQGSPGDGDVATGFYEAEERALPSPLILVEDDLASGGAKVKIPHGQSLTFADVQSIGADSRMVVVYYEASVSIPATITVNGGPTSVALPASAGITDHREFFTLIDGTNSITIANGHASADLYLDKIYVYPGIPDGGSPTGIIDPDKPFPIDRDSPQGFYSNAMAQDGQGTTSGTTVGGGQAGFEFYTGTEDQLQSPVIVAIEGPEITPAYRGSCVFVADTYTLRGAQFSNFTFEIDPGMSDLAAIVRDLCIEDGYTSDQLDVTDLAGNVVDGLVINSYQPLSNILERLETWFGFDHKDEGGKLVFKMRGGSSIATITADELGAYSEGDTPPQGLVKTSYLAEQDLPAAIHVSYLEPDPEKDYHTAMVTAQRSVGYTVEPIEESFPLVSGGDAAQAVGLRLLYEIHHAAKPREWTVGPKYAYLNPADIVTLQLPNKTLVERILGASKSLLGPQKFKSIPERAAIYTQALPGGGGGRPPNPVGTPSNIELWLADLTPLRFEDNGLGYYVAGCPRGVGSFKGFFEYQEVAGEYELVTGFEQASMIGVIVGSFGAPPVPGVPDYTNTLTVDFYFDSGEIQSRPFTDITAAALNVLAIGEGNNVEIVQYQDAVQQSTSSPYVVRYQFSTLIRGINGTESMGAAHVAGDTVVVIGQAVKFRKAELSEIGIQRNYKGVAVGQAVNDAVAVPFLFRGQSQRPLAPAQLQGNRSANGDLNITWVHRVRVNGQLRDYVGTQLSEEEEIYVVEIWNGSTLLRTSRVRAGRLFGEPIEWRSLRNKGIEPTVATDGSVTMNGLVSTLRSTQVFNGDFTFELGSNPTDDPIPQQLYIQTAGLESTSGNKFFQFARPAGLGNSDCFISDIAANGSTLLNVSVDATGPVRLYIQRLGSDLRVFRGALVATTAPVMIAQQDWSGGLTVTVLNQSDEHQDNILYQPRVAVPRSRSFLYSANMQTQDFGSPQSAITVKVYQESALTGAGDPAEGTL